MLCAGIALPSNTASKHLTGIVVCCYKHAKHWEGKMFRPCFLQIELSNWKNILICYNILFCDVPQEKCTNDKLISVLDEEVWRILNYLNICYNVKIYLLCDTFIFIKEENVRLLMLTVSWINWLLKKHSLQKQCFKIECWSDFGEFHLTCCAPENAW